MNKPTFDNLVHRVLKDVEELQKKKGVEYSSTADRLSNFKEEAKNFNVHPMVVLGIYMNKHVTLVKKYIRAVQSGNLQELQSYLTEPIEGRFKDIIVYCLLGMALAREVEEEVVQQEVYPAVPSLRQGNEE